MRNFILLLSFTTVSFLFAIFTGGEILYYIFFALSSILLLSILYSIIGRESIKLKIDIKDSEIHVGEKIGYKIKIKNKWFLPLIFIAIDDKNESFFPITTNLNPFQKKVIKRSIECKRRGIYKIGPVKIKLRDPFGIFEVKKTFNKKHKIIVYPNVYDISIELPAIAEIGRAEGKNKQYEDYTNLSNLREYIDGDSLKRVHWRISAKLQKLYVKEYEYTASNEVFIIWDLYRQHYKEDYNGMIDEKTAECVLSIAKYCLANGVPVSLVDYESNKHLVRCKSIKDFSILKLLTLKLFPTYDSDFDEKLLNNIRRVSRESTLVIITPYVDENTVFTLSNINLHQNVIIFYTNKAPLEEETKRKLDNLGIKFISWGDKYEDIHKKFNIFEYIITVILSVILSLSIFVGLNFNVSILDIIFLSSVLVALLTFLFKRPQLIIAFLSLFILVDLYYFYMKKDVLTKVVVDIDRYINWLYIYMGETNWPDGFSQLTSRYFLTTVILGIFVVALAITFLNSILKSYFLTMLFGILVLVFQWYNYIDKAYTYLIFYIAVSFINMSINYYQKAGNGKASIVSLLVISIVFSSISTAIAYALPKSFQPVVWKSMNDKFYTTFPFTKTWRNGIGVEGTTTTFSTDFGSFSQDLGGPESVSDQIVMRVKADESTYLRGEVFDTYENNRWTNSEIQHNFGNGNYFPPAFSKGIKYTIRKLEIYPVAMNTNIIFSPWQPYHVSINNIYDKSSLALISMGRRIKSPYVVEYYKPDISVKDLENDKTVASDDMKRYLQYPDNLPERVKELALSITKDKKTDYDKVKAVEQYLRNTYKYNLDVPETPPGRDFVDYFLFDLKQGYCTYFATSMVIMLRTIGIPARYVVGFKMPPPPIFGDNYDIKASYAHAWVEVHFQNSGWVTFEPTAIYSETFSQAAGADSGTPSSTQPNTNTGNVAIPKTNVNQNKMQDNIVKNQAGNNIITRRNMYTTIIIIWLLITLALAIAAAIKYVLLKKYLDSNKNAYVYYYNKILKSLGKRGLRKDDSETTIEYQERVMSAGFKDFDRVTKVYNDLAYGNVEPSKDDVVYIKEYLKRNIRNRKIFV